jgi:hypothetical protein
MHMTTTAKVAACALGLLAACLTVPTAHATTETPPPGSLVVKKVSTNGSGCPGQSASVAASLDNFAFTVTFSAFTAIAGPESTRKQDNAKDCRLKIKVDVPKSYTYSLTAVDVRGFGHLEEGATGSHTLEYAFPSAKSDPMTQAFTGPFDDFWQASHVAPTDFAPCGASRNLTVDNALSVDAGSSPAGTTSLLTIDSADASTSLIYHVTWKKC